MRWRMAVRSGTPLRTLRRFSLVAAAAEAVAAAAVAVAVVVEALG